MIISGGESITAPRWRTSRRPSRIVEVAVIGPAHEKWARCLIAVAAIAGTTCSSTTSPSFWPSGLARYKHSKALEVVDALPRNPAGRSSSTESRVRYGAAYSGEEVFPPQTT